jgi:hypothetical protein
MIGPMVMQHFSDLLKIHSPGHISGKFHKAHERRGACHSRAESKCQRCYSFDD